MSKFYDSFEVVEGQHPGKQRLSDSAIYMQGCFGVHSRKEELVKRGEGNWH